MTTGRARAAVQSAVFFLVAPGTFGAVIPGLWTRWHLASAEPPWTGLRWVGGVLVVVAGAFLVSAFVRFVVDGLGTPAPILPTQHLVVTGVYRHIRNPMYVAVTTVIGGQALVCGRPALLAYAAAFLVTTATFVRAYEEPTLEQQFPTDYPAYRDAVPGWWPRMRPWTPDTERISE